MSHSNAQVYNPSICGLKFTVILKAVLFINIFLMISNAVVYEKSDRTGTLDICHEDLHNYALFVIVFSSILIVLSSLCLILISKNYTLTNSFLFNAVYWCLTYSFVGSLIFNTFVMFAWLPRQSSECKDDFYAMMIIDSISISVLCGLPYALYQVYKLVVYYQNFGLLPTSDPPIFGGNSEG